MTLHITTQPATEPITLAEAKLHCRIDQADEDAWITSAIVAARQAAEHALGRKLIAQTWELLLDAFPDGAIELPAGVLAITEVRYTSTAQADTVLSSGAYVLDPYNVPAWLLPVSTWPDTYDTANAVRVKFTQGFGPAASDVPNAIKQWMLLHIGTAYKFREAVVDARNTELPGRFHDSLLDPYRVAWA